jgi:single-stranded-DNA-specific exonuclease
MKKPRFEKRTPPRHVSPGALAGYSDLARTLLINRNICTDEEAELFLNGSFDSGSHDPFLMSGMNDAVERIFRALKHEETIAIFSDYDADGIPGGVVARSFLERIGGSKIVSYIPHRGFEGFGLSKGAIDELHTKGVTLIVTVDCGITDVEEVAYAKTLGIDVIITDHHLPPEELPDALAILNPRQSGCAYPFKELCGAGVAYKLVQALIQSGNADFPPGHEKWFLDLVGIATLADMVPLVGENRTFARFGLLVLRKGRRPGLRELFHQAGVDYRFVNEEDVLFTVAPRINAAGRMAHPDIAFALLFSNSRVEAERRALELEEINKERKALVLQIVRDVKKKLSRRDLGPVIVVGDPSWKPGILGLIASALVDSFGKTAFVWGREGGNGHLKGSARSDGVHNVVELMRSLPEGSLISFGGHERSGGFSLELDRVDALGELLNARAAAAASEREESAPKLYDLDISAQSLSEGVFEDVLSLSPFGIGFEKPLFKIEDARIVSAREFGKAKNHLEIQIEGEGGATFNSIGFFMTREHFDVDLEKGNTVTLYGSFEKSFYRPRPEFRIRIEHVE